MTLHTADQHPVYIGEPEVVATPWGLLLLGSYRRVVLRDDSASMVADGSIGGFVDSNGEVTPLPPPPNTGAVLLPRAVGDPSGEIHVVWGEADDTAPVFPTIQRLRYARLNGMSWSSPETVLQGARLRWGYSSASNLVLHDSTMFFAVAESDSRQVRHWISVLRGSGSSWTQTRLENLFPAITSPLGRATAKLGVVPVSYVDIGRISDGRLLMAFVAANLDSLRDNNSLFVSRSDDGGTTWSPPALVQAGGQHPVDQIRLLTIRPDRIALVWKQGAIGTFGGEAVGVAVSIDRGQTWRRERNAPVEGGIAFGPMRAVADSAGNVDVIVSAALDSRIKFLRWGGGRWADCGAPRDSVRREYAVGAMGRDVVLVWGAWDRTQSRDRFTFTRVAWFAHRR